jgi:conjugal transfer/entry exclusion protein
MEQIEFKNLLKEREELIQKLKKINNQINFYQNKLETDEKKNKKFQK